MPKKKLVPREVTEENINLLQDDATNVGEYSLMVDGKSVWLGRYQTNKQGQVVEVPRKIFEALIKWWASGVVPQGKFNKLS